MVHLERKKQKHEGSKKNILCRPEREILSRTETGLMKCFESTIRWGFSEGIRFSMKQTSYIGSVCFYLNSTSYVFVNERKH